MRLSSWDLFLKQSIEVEHVLDGMTGKIILEDIANGTEDVCIPVVNDIDDEEAPKVRGFVEGKSFLDGLFAKSQGFDRSR